MSKRTTPTRNLTYSVPLKLTPKLDKKVEAAMSETGLKKSDILRMSLERGVDVLLAQLKGNINTEA